MLHEILELPPAERVRVTAQLIKAADGSRLWSQTYDRELGDIFKVQDEVSGTVAQELRTALVGDSDLLRRLRLTG